MKHTHKRFTKDCEPCKAILHYIEFNGKYGNQECDTLALDYFAYSQDHDIQGMKKTWKEMVEFYNKWINYEGQEEVNTE